MDGISLANTQLAVPLPTSFPATPNPKAEPAVVAAQFESMFATMILKQMRQSLDGETMFGKDPGDIMGGMFDQFLGDHIGKSGALGVGEMIRSQLERRATPA